MLDLHSFYNFIGSYHGVCFQFLQGLGLRPGVIDGAISISAVQVCLLVSINPFLHQLLIVMVLKMWLCLLVYCMSQIFASKSYIVCSVFYLVLGFCDVSFPLEKVWNAN